MHAPSRPIAVYYEHPDWFRPLFEALERRGAPFQRLHADEGPPDGLDPSRYSLLFNRMSPSAHRRGRSRAIFEALPLIERAERAGLRVVNGSRAFRMEISKESQARLMEDLGLPHPRTRPVASPSLAPEAAEGLRFPVLTKANVGGSGAGITRFDDPDQLREAASAGLIDLGPDATGVVQEALPREAQRITRLEFLDGRLLYSIRVYSAGDTFNLCPASVCCLADGSALQRQAYGAEAPRNSLRVEAFEPDGSIVEQAARLINAAGIDVGAVEYLVDERDGTHQFFDVNALSNFVADAPRVVGFDPHERLAEFLFMEACKS